MKRARGRLVATLRWGRDALRRRRLDGRFAPRTVGLVREVARLELRRRAQWLVASLALAGIGHAGGRPASRRVIGEWRRRVVGPEVAVPLAELPHVFAEAIVPRLRGAGLAPFLVDDADGTLHFGLPVSARSSAVTVLAGLDRAEGWYVAARRGGRTHVGPVASRSGRRRARRAESWRLYRYLGHGAGVVGPEQGVVVSFWAPAAGGRMERIGLRGLHRFEAGAAPTVERVAGREYPGLVCFPVERALTRFREPVDAVVTWVDGDDPVWRARFDEWRRRDHPSAADDQAVHRARFTSRDELRYVLRSLWSHAGWIRTVYVVTADQTPEWLVPDERLRVVSHREIFPAGWLPTFNSHAIEARLHHIDGLAEHFVYLNDDMFVGRPVRPEQFFTPNGLPLFFESEARIPLASGGGHDRSVDVAARRGQELLAREFGMLATRKLHHAPYALRRSVLAELEDRFRPEVEATARHRFRHPGDVSIPSAFAHHYGFATGRAVPGELAVTYENLGSRRLGLTLRRLLLGRDADAICINETERWETDPQRAAERLGAFLAAYHPVPSPWERP